MKSSTAIYSTTTTLGNNATSKLQQDDGNRNCNGNRPLLKQKSITSFFFGKSPVSPPKTPSPKTPKPSSAVSELKRISSALNAENSDQENVVSKQLLNDSPTPVKRAKTFTRLCIESPSISISAAEEKIGEVVLINEQSKNEVCEADRVEREQRESLKIERITRRLRKYLNAMDNHSFAREIVTVARLRKELVQKIQSPFIRYLIQREAEKRRTSAAMKSMTVEQRRAYKIQCFRERRLGEPNFHFDEIYQHFLAGRFEDMAVAERKMVGAAKRREKRKKSNEGEEEKEKKLKILGIEENEKEEGKRMANGEEATRNNNNKEEEVEKAEENKSGKDEQQKQKQQEKLLLNYEFCAFFTPLSVQGSSSSNSSKNNNNNNDEIAFGRLLAITQFLHSHRAFLFKHRIRLSVLDFLAVLNCRDAVLENGKCAARVESALSLLLNVLLANTDKKVRRGNLRSSGFSLDRLKNFLSSEIADLKKQNDDDERSIEDGEMTNETEEEGGRIVVERRNGEEVEIENRLSKVLTELEQTAAEHFVHLCADSQLLVFEHIVARIYALSAFHEYLDSTGKTQLVEAQKRLAEIEEEISTQKNNLKLIMAKVGGGVFASENEETAESSPTFSSVGLSRRQTANLGKKERLIGRTKKELDALQIKLAKQQMCCQLLNFVYAYRTVPLGQDRFHRNYWFFACSPDDNAIFVQQEPCDCCSSSTTNVVLSESSFVSSFSPSSSTDQTQEVDTFFRQMQRQIVARPCPGHTETWWSIESLSGFVHLCDSLFSEGVRESELKQQLCKYRDIIVVNLKEKEEEEEESGEEEEEEEKNDELEEIGAVKNYGRK